MTADTFEKTTLLVGIGPPRTASKWLSFYCESHPQILMSPIRVLHYFDSVHGKTEQDFNQMFADRLSQLELTGSGQTRGAQALRERLKMTDDANAFLDYFRSRWTGERVLADITPGYVVQDLSTFQQMLKAHSRVKIQVTLRNPIDRFWSGISRRQMSDYGPILTEKLKKTVAMEQQGVHTPSNYVAVLKKLERCASEDQYRAVFFENLLSGEGIAEFCNWLGVDTVPAELNKPVNKSTDANPTPDQREQMYEVLAPNYQYMQDRFGSDLPQSWRQDMALFG